MVVICTCSAFFLLLLCLLPFLANKRCIFYVFPFYSRVSVSAFPHSVVHFLQTWSVWTPVLHFRSTQYDNPGYCYIAAVVACPSSSLLTTSSECRVDAAAAADPSDVPTLVNAGRVCQTTVVLCRRPLSACRVAERTKSSVDDSPTAQRTC